MNFWQIFVRVLPWRPLPALSALWWHLTRRRVRARNQLRTAGGDLPFAYRLWMRTIEGAHNRQISTSSDTQDWSSSPNFSVVIDARGRGDEAVDRSIRSVQAQHYRNWNIIILGAESEAAAFQLSEARAVADWASALRDSTGEFIVPLIGGDQLSEWALFLFADAVAKNSDALLVYGDEDHIGAGGRRERPFFKPGWNKELLLALDYVSRACAFRRGTVGCVSPSDAPAEVVALILALTTQPRFEAVHISKIITHSGDADAADPAEAVTRHVSPSGATVSRGPFGTVKVSWPLPAELPLVTIIIPTKDRVELLEACIHTITAQTDYSRFELLIVDNESIEPRTLKYFDSLSAQPNIRVLRYPGAYNYSAINNFAVGRAAGTFVCLLNNDTEVVTPEWLTEMMRYAVRPDIGAVGAKLLYPDGTIQHAGVIVGIGDAVGHPHRNLGADDPGYFKLAHVAQYVSAVTGACLLVDKRKFLAVGGLDEESLPVAYNDVDFCLKLQRAGWHNVYVPHAVLIHHESKSRAKDHSRGRIDAYKRELRAFQERWNAENYNDPSMNPNLDRSNETFVIRF